MTKTNQYCLKRLFDISASITIAVILLPFMIVLAILIKLSSEGPVFFIQERVGLHGNVFKMIKFRSMSGKPEKNSIRWTSSDEARITRLGMLMRDYGFDELPQVINILKGDMSIIGPRPALPQQVALFPPELLRMFDMRPGVLSLAAIKGRRSLSMQDRYMLHVEYVNLWSLNLDFKILWQSLFVVLGRISATEKLDN